jgi:hypothetical protein
MHLLIVTIWFTLSVSLGPKVFTLSRAHCNIIISLKGCLDRRRRFSRRSQNVPALLSDRILAWVGPDSGDEKSDSRFILDSGRNCQLPQLIEFLFVRKYMKCFISKILKILMIESIQNAFNQIVSNYFLIEKYGRKYENNMT